MTIVWWKSPWTRSIYPLLSIFLLAHEVMAMRENCVNSSLDLKAEYLEFFTNAIMNLHYNPYTASKDGSDWPETALTMIGARRLHNFAAIVSLVVNEGIHGDIIETGVWRGGASFLAAKTLELLCDDRKVYMADSFSGIPDMPKDLKHYKGWIKDNSASRIEILNKNSVESVKRDLEVFGVNKSKVVFVEGYFNESLPRLVEHVNAPIFSVIRLDGDTYYSTMDSLKALYPRLSPGGFLIIDDFVDWRGCRTAVEEYRFANRIREEIVLVPHRHGESALGAYWRKDDPNDKDRQVCVGSPPGQLRVRGSYNPARLEMMPPDGPPGVDIGSHGLKGSRNMFYCTD